MSGTTNLLQWNPAAANQENDAAYLADSQRSGGAVDPSFFASVLANKAFYQWSTYLAALFQAFANKGFTTSDSNLSTLTAQCANFLTTADLLPAVQLVPYTASVTLNAAAANGFYIEAMTGNLTITAVNGLTSGQRVALSYQQDAVGGRTVTFASIFVGALQPDPAASSVSAQLFEYDSVTTKLRAIGPLVSNNGVFTGALKAASFTLASPGSAGQVLTNVGGVFVPQSPGFTSVTNSNGTYRVAPDGVIECWGSAPSVATGGNHSTASITFPTSYTTPPKVFLTLVGIQDPSGTDPAIAQLLSVSTSGASATLMCAVPTGGGGANFVNSINVDFYAIGK